VRAETTPGHVHGGYSAGVLRGQRRNRGQAVHAVRGKGFEVGLKAGAPAGVGTGDGEGADGAVIGAGHGRSTKNSCDGAVPTAARCHSESGVASEWAARTRSSGNASSGLRPNATAGTNGWGLAFASSTAGPGLVATSVRSFERKRGCKRRPVPTTYGCDRLVPALRRDHRARACPLVPDGRGL
jgi:hypothetical protein